MKNIQAISLDLDDTLWSISPVILRAEEKIQQYLVNEYSRINSNAISSDCMEAIEEIRQRHPEVNHDLTEIRRLSFEVILKKYDYDPTGSNNLIDLYLDLRHDVELFPEVLSALKILAEQFKLVALSNGNADLRRLEIKSYFTGQVSAGEFGIRKPDRSIFHKACEVLGTNPESVLHVGDHPTEDVMGAEQAGLKSVWVNRFGRDWPLKDKPSAELHDLNGLIELLSIEESRRSN